MINKPKTYAIVNPKTKKIIKHFGRLQYFRLKAMAGIKKMELEHELETKLEVVKDDRKIQKDKANK